MEGGRSGRFNTAQPHGDAGLDGLLKENMPQHIGQTVTDLFNDLLDRGTTLSPKWPSALSPLKRPSAGNDRGRVWFLSRLEPDLSANDSASISGGEKKEKKERKIAETAALFDIW